MVLWVEPRSVPLLQEDASYFSWPAAPGMGPVRKEQRKATRRFPQRPKPLQPFYRSLLGVRAPAFLQRSKLDGRCKSLKWDMISAPRMPR